MHFVYILQSDKTKGLYIGYTSDLKQRIKMHNNKQSNYTRKFTPWRLVYFEGYLSDVDAKKRERSLKHHAQGLRRLRERLTNSMVQVM